MKGLTATQERILKEAVPSMYLPTDERAALPSEVWLSPLEIAQRFGKYATAGGCARSLRVLLARGLVRQKKLPYRSSNGFELFVYASKKEEA